LTTYASATNNEVGIATAVGTAAGPTASQGTGYTLSNIGFQIVRYDMPQSYSQAVAGVLEAGSEFKLYYPNYSSFMSTAQRLPKGGTSRFNLSTQSLDMVISISTFQVQDRGTQQAPILGLWVSNGVGSLPGDSSFRYNAAATNTGLPAVASAAGEFGIYTKAFPFGLTAGWPKLLNNSKYFVRNGDGI
jgi:hypothetical protein